MARMEDKLDSILRLAGSPESLNSNLLDELNEW
jgi:hypothetical protein